MSISPDQSAHVKEIARKHRLSLVLLFGSSVKGRTHSRSDIDIAVRRREAPLNLDEYLELRQELQDVFPDREVDLARIDHADPLFLKQVTENCTLLHGDPKALAELKILAFRRYQDYRKYFRMEREFARKALARIKKTG